MSENEQNQGRQEQGEQINVQEIIDSLRAQREQANDREAQALATATHYRKKCASMGEVLVSKDLEISKLKKKIEELSGGAETTEEAPAKAKGKTKH